MRFYLLLAVATLSLSPSLSRAADATASFADAQAVLRKYCVACHSQDEAEGKLALDSHAAIAKGGSRGAAITPGDTQRSLLLRVIDGIAKPKMPPAGSESPKPEEVEILRRWITSGAPAPDGSASDPYQLVTPNIPTSGQPRLPITAAAISPDGKLLALGLYNQVRLVSTTYQTTVATLDGQRGQVTDLAFSADGKLLAAAAGIPGLVGETQVFTVADRKRIKTLTGHSDALYAVAFSPDGKQLVTAGYDKSIVLWDMAGEKKLHTIEGHNGAVFDLAFHPSGRWFASASADRTAKIWDAATGNRIDTLGQAVKELYAVTISPDGNYLLTGGVDNRLRVYACQAEANEGSSELLHSRFAHEGAVLEIAFDAAGKTLATSAEDSTLKLWNAEDFLLTRTLPAQPDWVAALALTPDGKQVAAARLDGTLAFYQSENGQPAQPPKAQLSAVAPQGAQIGSTVEITLTGEHVAAATAAQTSGQDIAVELLAADASQPKTRRAKLTIPSNAAPGRIDIWLTSPVGDSERQKIWLDTPPQLAETEPNNTSQQAQLLDAASGVWGAISKAGDADRYRLAAKSGETVVAQLEVAEFGSKLRGLLTLTDETGRPLERISQSQEGKDVNLTYTLQKDTTVELAVGDVLLSGSANHNYRLTFGVLPLVTGVFPPSVAMGEKTELQLVGYNLPAGAAVQVQGTGSITVPIDKKRFRTAGPLRVQALTEPQTLEQEPNNSPSEATVMTVPGHASGTIGSGGDADIYRFAAKAGDTYIIETHAARIGSRADTRIAVLDVQGAPVRRVLLQATRDSLINFRPIDSNSNQVRVDHWEEMELNEYLYMNGEVAKLFRMPQGPDSGFLFYTWKGKRIGYFDTSPTDHALHEPVYIVQPLGENESPVPNGLPLFELYYENDDDGERRHGTDSVLTFTAPADGEYLVRVEDSRNLGSPNHAYRLTIRQPQPDYSIAISGATPTIPGGSGREINFDATRSDNFSGPIHIEVADLPQGVRISQPIMIEAGHDQAQAVLYVDENADPAAIEKAAKAKVTSWAMINGEKQTKELGQLGPAKVAGNAKLRVFLEPEEIEIRPGTTITATLRIERNDFKDRVQFDVGGLPHGVIVDNIGLNGVLLPPEVNQRTIFLTAAPWVQPMQRPFHATATNAGREVSPPVMLKVVK